MNVFWRFGYEHTSLGALMREMGIAKQSLYDTFGDKRALYLKALRTALPNFCSVSAANHRKNTNGAAYCSARIWSAMQKIKSSLSFCWTIN